MAWLTVGSNEGNFIIQCKLLVFSSKSTQTSYLKSADLTFEKKASLAFYFKIDNAVIYVMMVRIVPRPVPWQHLLLATVTRGA